MPHSPEDKKRILTRVRRIRGRLMPLNARWSRAIPVWPSCSKLPPCAVLPMA
jgi:hypothetical protein